jgi:ribokinase
MVRVAVVGHVEWVGFAPVSHVPLAGEIVHAHGYVEQAAGGGAVAAVALARLAGASDFLTALGGDEPGRLARQQLEGQGVTVHSATRDEATRRAFTFLDDGGERTITVLGERVVPFRDDPLPWADLAGVDGVYFTGGDAGALVAARAAGVLVATPRARNAFAGSGVQLDVLVRSGRDEHETIDAAALQPQPRVEVVTEGERGGRWQAIDGSTGRYDAVEPPGPVVDAYGCGDSFAAGLTYGLATGEGRLGDALAIAARAGATCLTGRGPYGAPLGRD